MSDPVLARLAAAGYALPVPPRPAANYIPYRISGNDLHIAGQTCTVNDVPVCTGTVGLDVTIEEAVAAARQCALNVLAQVGSACEGDFTRVTALKMVGYVRCTANFGQQPLVLNGASDLFVLALGERGRHTRVAIGTHALPRNCPVEIEALFRLD